MHVSNKRKLIILKAHTVLTEYIKSDRFIKDKFILLRR